MNVTPDFFELLRSKVNVSDVVRQKVTLKKKGAEYSGLCPFHNEKSPSFTVNDVKRFYHCFGCHVHGDVIRFVSETSGLRYKDAAIKLAGDHGIEIPKLSKAEERLYEEIDQIHHTLQVASEFFQKNLVDKAPLASKYLASRHLSQSTCQNYKLGYAPGADTLRKYLEQHKIPLMMMDKAGLIGKGEDGSIYETFRDRIMFPIRNLYGKVIGFGGRATGNAMPKYLNSPETIVFKKNEVLYGEDKAISSAYKTGKIIVVEGYMDVIAMQSHGFENTVASLGTAVTSNHLTKLWHTADEIVMCLDGDSAGLKASLKVVEQSLPRITTEKSISFILMPQSQDPDDILVKHGASYMQGLFNSRLSMAEMIWHLEVKDQIFSTPEKRAALEQSLQNYANTAVDPALKRNYSRYFKEQTWKYFSSKNTKTKISSAPKLPSTMREGEIIEHTLVSLLITSPELLYIENIRESIASITFHDELLSKMCAWLLGQALTTDSLDAEALKALAKSTSFLEIFMLLSSPDFIFLDNTTIVDRNPEILWDIFIKKHNLIKSKAEYTELMNSSNEDAFNKARKYQQEILKLQQEIDIISDNLTQRSKYE